MKLHVTDKGHDYLTAIQYAKISNMTEEDMLTGESLEEFLEFDDSQLPEYMALRIKYILYLLRGKKLVELIPETGLEEAELTLIDSYKKPKPVVAQEVLDAVTEAKKLEKGDKKKSKKIKGDKKNEPKMGRKRTES